jgi:hypothetical protein
LELQGGGEDEGSVSRIGVRADLTVLGWTRGTGHEEGRRAGARGNNDEGKGKENVLEGRGGRGGSRRA